MNPNECVLCVYVKIWRFFHIREIFVFLINDYLLIADLHIFIYGRAECATISLECTKGKLLILNNLKISSFPFSFIPFNACIKGRTNSLVQRVHRILANYECFYNIRNCQKYISSTFDDCSFCRCL